MKKYNYIIMRPTKKIIFSIIKVYLKLIKQNIMMLFSYFISIIYIFKITVKRKFYSA